VKKAAVAVLALALIMLFSAVPVRAKTEKVPASMTIAYPDYSPGNVWFTNGGIIQSRGSPFTFEVLELDIGGSTHIGVLSAVLDDTVNLKTQVDNCHFKAVLTLDESTDNGFAGNIHTKFTMILTAEGWETDSALLQGFGVYKRQTLVLNYNGPWLLPGETITWTGYCLKG